MPETKKCLRCERLLALSEFSATRKKNGDIYYYQMCKDCYKKLAEYKRTHAPETKICTMCRKEKPISAYKHEIRSKDGYKTWCTDCAREYHKKRYERHNLVTCSVCGETMSKQQTVRKNLCKYNIGDAPICRRCYKKIKHDKLCEEAHFPKRCAVCGEWKPRTEFHISHTNYDGLSHQCKTCHAIYKKNYLKNKKSKNHGIKI